MLGLGKQNTLIRELNLLDIWKDYEPKKTEYCSYSSTYQTHSHIDYFLISASIISKVQECYYGSIVISDHTAVSLVYTDSGLVRDPSKWRFQPGWLLDPTFIKFIDQKTDLYFEMNISQTSACIRWEAFKALLNKILDSWIKTLEKDMFHYRPGSVNAHAE